MQDTATRPPSMDQQAAQAVPSSEAGPSSSAVDKAPDADEPDSTEKEEHKGLSRAHDPTKDALASLINSCK